MYSKKVYESKLEIVFDNFIEGTCTIFDYRLLGLNLVIIQADSGSVNPSEYSFQIYNNLKPNKDTTILLDLTNIHCKSQDNIYIWKFIIKNNELEDEDFIPISEHKIKSRFIYHNIRKYIDNVLGYNHRTNVLVVKE